GRGVPGGLLHALGGLLGGRRGAQRRRRGDLHGPGDGRRQQRRRRGLDRARPRGARAPAAAHGGAAPGAHVTARGPVPRQPRGVQFAAKHAEAVFVSGPTTKIVRGSVDKLRAAVAEQGRDARSVKVFAMLTPVVAETGEQAREKLRDYQRLVSVPGAFALFGGWTGVDLAEFEPDEPLRYVESDANRSALASFTTADPDRTWTPRELGRWIGLGGRGPVVTGSPSEVADELERWVEE